LVTQGGSVQFTEPESVSGEKEENCGPRGTTLL